MADPTDSPVEKPSGGPADKPPDRPADTATAEPTPGEPGGAGVPGLDELGSWVGHRLDGIGGGSVGKVEGIYVDASTGTPAWLLARMGRFGHRSLVPAEDAVEGVGHVWVPYDRDAIRGAPRIEPGDALTTERELELCTHYGIPEGKGRAAEISDRSPDAISTRPAEPGQD